MSKIIQKTGGSISLTWLVGTGISVAIVSTGAFFGLSNKTNGQISEVIKDYTEADQSIVQRLSVSETKISNLEELKQKIDALNENVTTLLIINGVSPAKIKK